MDKVVSSSNAQGFSSFEGCSTIVASFYDPEIPLLKSQSTDSHDLRASDSQLPSRMSLEASPPSKCIDKKHELTDGNSLFLKSILKTTQVDSSETEEKSAIKKSVKWDAEVKNNGVVESDEDRYVSFVLVSESQNFSVKFLDIGSLPCQNFSEMKNMLAKMIQVLHPESSQFASLSSDRAQSEVLRQESKLMLECVFQDSRVLVRAAKNEKKAWYTSKGKRLYLRENACNLAFLSICQKYLF